MTLQSSGAISLSNIRDEYNNGSSAPIDLDDYYRGGSFVRANASNNTSTNLSADVPTSANSSPLSINDFYGQTRAFRKTFSDGNTNQSADTIFGDDFEVDYPKQLVISSGHTIGATSSSNAALTIESNGVGSITITNEGSIEGAGGAAGAAGGNALQVDGSVAVTLVNNGTIKAGGGGGGAGGAGGNGVFTANATFSSLVDQGGGGSSTPANNQPSWLNSIYTSAGNLDGVGVVSDRLWRGINGQFSRGIGQPGQFQINHSGSAGSGFNANCANRGPIYISAQTNTTGVYTVNASISSQYGSGYGTPTISVSTSTSSAGSSFSNSGSANITASTTTYFTAYGTTSNGKNYYYNSLSMSVAGTCLAIQSGASGGAGGVGQGFNQSATSGSGGSSGSNNAGSGGTGGAGGAFGAAGSTGSTGGNGSGSSVSFPSSAPTSGSSGSAGGASGKSIQGVSNVTETGSGTKTGGTA